ncbi:MAG TPA: bifunctional nuclease domain-containing protein [Rectinemataceae bacterium]|nr:bifunctional nuclease domain-containing protein [Rectinemataceae bacterium]
MMEEYVTMQVSGVSVEEGDALPLVYLRESLGSGEGGLSVRVGPFEASAILLQLEGITPTRLLTHDLLAELFREGGMSLERAELFGSPAEAPRARIVYRHGFTRRAKEVRPSDALALALRLKAPICAERCLMTGPARTLSFRPGESQDEGLEVHPRRKGRTSA